ncbi:helix-turn-helix transcriptional regulator [Fictibacillus sp. KIGAM418]|uniref:Helix-turn-helix transcriptional regulator n=1 Tax=Fictibacillus marinisediminis TaxID=2878389 RepID=A0A9X1XCZ4_9BACL|nr:MULTISPECIES: helix-turn-helix transcriptional regulator [Fictibacillus]MCK6257123.1 helix-turn-helix transcriptional regulator [Fictibacillus marinisediminis]MED2973188.1 helix-turn-helix transcriptional regulator [Fictibacillus sp. B-59209]UZJ77046.1 helix-turn-helix transcriptional regulator [Fictibacillus sp. KU28468]SFD89840.1 Cro/C1-type HTH DNA-binding domain-containing protein [Bacillus sp. OV194]
MNVYKPKKSNLKSLIADKNMKIQALSKKTNISVDQLNDYQSKKVMSLSNAMTIAKELDCQIEELYDWKIVKE